MANSFIRFTYTSHIIRYQCPFGLIDSEILQWTVPPLLEHSDVCALSGGAWKLNKRTANTLRSTNFNVRGFQFKYVRETIYVRNEFARVALIYNARAVR